MTNPQDKRTASQRIDDLERAVMSIFQVSNNMARENTMIKDALKLLGSRVTALIQLAASGTVVSEDGVDKIMRENQIKELQGKVQNLIDQGFLVATEAVAENTFLVGSENEPDQADGTAGKTIHPRLQFTLSSLEKDIQEKLTGAKVGDTVKFKDDALVFKLAEVYRIVNPTPAPAPVAAAPEAEQSSTDAAQAAAPAASDQVAGN